MITAKNIAESLTRGSRAIVTGRLRQRTYETEEGDKRTVYEVEADEVGASLRNASAKITRASRASASGPARAQGQAEASPRAGKDAGGYSGEPRF